MPRAYERKAPEERNNRNLTIPLSGPLLAVLERVAAQQQTTKTRLARELIQQGLKQLSPEVLVQAT